MGHWISNILRSLSGLILNHPCPICQRPTSDDLCLDCRRQIQDCQLPNPAQLWQGNLPVLAWGAYGGALKRAIAALKYDRHAVLARPLGFWLGETWLAHLRQIPPQQVPPKKLLVVPIPIHADKLQKRGFNQAERLADAFCQCTGLPLQEGLKRIRATEAQFGLSTLDRERNLQGAFQVSISQRVRSGATVLLLDDIYTSGATARSAAQTLQQAGIPVYGLVAVAAPMYAGKSDRPPSV